jgi:hypothetical protein
MAATISKARQWIAFSSLGTGVAAITSDGTGMEVFEWRMSRGQSSSRRLLDENDGRHDRDPWSPGSPESPQVRGVNRQLPKQARRQAALQPVALLVLQTPLLS